MKPEEQSLVGESIGKWTVMDQFVLTTKGERKLLCRCECGTQRYVLERSLKYGGSKSCGCLRKAQAEKANAISNIAGKTFGELTVLHKASINAKTVVFGGPVGARAGICTMFLLLCWLQEEGRVAAVKATKRTTLLLTSQGSVSIA